MSKGNAVQGAWCGKMEASANRAGGRSVSAKTSMNVIPGRVKRGPGIQPCLISHTIIRVKQPQFQGGLNRDEGDKGE